MSIYLDPVHIPFAHAGPKASESGYESSVHSIECSRDEVEQESHLVQSRFGRGGQSLYLKVPFTNI